MHGRPHPNARTVRVGRFLGVTGALILATALALPGSPAAASVVAKVQLGTVDQFGVLAGSAVTNTGNTIVGGLDLGVSPGTAVTGFPPGVVLPPGTMHLADGVASQAQRDATTAYNQAAGLPADNPVAYTELGGKTLDPGVYQGNLSLTGTVTLNNNDDPDAVFVFQASSTLITASSSVVTFTNADHPSCNVFWQVGSSATLGSGSTFVGTVDALTTITAGTAATVQGRLIARNGAVNLDSNTITRAPCTVPPPPPPTTSKPPTTTPTTSKPPTSKPPTTTPTTTKPTTSKPTTSKPPTTTPRPTTTTTPPPLATSATTGSSLSISVPSTASNQTSTPATSTRRSTTSAQTSTHRSTTSDQSSTYTDVYGSSSTASTGYTDTFESTHALGITGSGGSSASGTLAATGAKVTGLLVAGTLLVLGGVGVLMFAGRRRIRTDGRQD